MSIESRAVEKAELASYQVLKQHWNKQASIRRITQVRWHDGTEAEVNWIEIYGQNLELVETFTLP